MQKQEKERNVGNHFAAVNSSSAVLSFLKTNQTFILNLLCDLFYSAVEILSCRYWACQRGLQTTVFISIDKVNLGPKRSDIKLFRMIYYLRSLHVRGREAQKQGGSHRSLRPKQNDRLITDPLIQCFYAFHSTSG